MKIPVVTSRPFQRTLREELRVQRRKERAHHDGPEHQPGGHLTDDARLPDEAQQPTARSRGGENDDELRKAIAVRAYQDGSYPFDML